MRPEAGAPIRAPGANGTIPPMPSFQFDFDRYPYLTADIPPVRGAIRTEDRDFQVTEVPAYPASGEGQHLYLLVEKEDQTTRRVIEALQAACGVKEDAIGWAGLKDRHALTRQWISVPVECEDKVSAIEEMPGVRILERARHTNKLQEGHLAGNRFRILVRHVEGDPADARRVLERLAASGVPNYFGPQRFGRQGDNAERGYQILTRPRGPSKRWLDKLLVNSLQSFLFNEWAALRMEQGTFDQVLLGDIAVKHASGGKFQVGDVAEEGPRAERLEISATGPLFGRKYHEAQDQARAIEDAVLARYELTREQFRPLPGSRRPLRFPLQDWGLEEAPEGLWLSFFLPSGAYATSVLREVMKMDPEPGKGSESEG